MSYSEDRLAVKMKGKWGFIDSLGATVVSPRYSCVFSFHEGVARCVEGEEDELVVFVGMDGEVLFRPPKCSRADVPQRDFHDGLAAISDNGRWGYMNRAGEWVIPPRFDSAGDFSEGLAPIATSGAAGFVDQAGSPHLHGKFLWCWPFSEGLAAVEFEKDLCGYIDRAGQVVVPAQFPRARDFVSGRALVMNMSGDWCYIDRRGAIVIPPVFVYANDFSEGRAAVTYHYGGDFGYIDADGNKVIEDQFGTADQFSHGLALVEKSAGRGTRLYIDRGGRIVWQGRQVPFPDDDLVMPDEAE